MVISQKKQTKYKKKISDFTVDRDHTYKSKETRVITYTCRYSSGLLIPIIQPVASG